MDTLKSLPTQRSQAPTKGFRFCLFNGHLREATEFVLPSRESDGNDASTTVEELQRKVASLAQIGTDNMILLFCLPLAKDLLFGPGDGIATALRLPKRKEDGAAKPLFVNLSSHTRKRRVVSIGCVAEEVGDNERVEQVRVRVGSESVVDYVAGRREGMNVLFVFDRSVIFKPVHPTGGVEAVVVRAKQDDDYQEIFECIQKNAENARLNGYRTMCQWKTIQAVKLNLNHYLEKLLSITNDFSTQSAEFHDDISQKLLGLEKEVAKIGKTVLPDSVKNRLKLQSVSAVTLADLVKVDLSIQVELEKLDRSISKKAQYLAEKFADIEDELLGSEVYCWEPPEMLARYPEKERVAEAADLLEGGMEYYGSLVQLSKQIESEVQDVAGIGRLMNEKFMQTLVLVSRVQSDIQQMTNKAFTWKEIFSSGETLKEQVSRMRELPNTFAACLAEVVRRRSFAKVYASEIQRLAEEVGTRREEEVKRREAFMRVRGQLLPSGIIPGIHDIQIPHIEVVRRQFDSQLPHVTIDEVHKAYIALDGLSEVSVVQENTDAPEQKGAVLLEPAEPSEESNAKQLKGEIERLQCENESLKAELLTLKQELKSKSSVA